MRLLNRRATGGVAAAAAIIAVSGGLSAAAATAATATTTPTAATATTTPTAATATTAAPGPPYVTVSAVLPAAARPATGIYHSSRMSVEVVLAPRNQAGLSSQLTAMYAHPKAGGHWLTKGQFATRYAPAAAARAAVAKYLRARHLAVAAVASPFLLRATGTSAQVSAAFRTTLKTYQNGRTTYFANATAAVLPATLAAGLRGVVGLSNTVRVHSMIKRLARPATSAQPGCQQPYPDRAALVNIVQDGLVPVRGYGAAPGCNGMSPSQVNSIYDAPRAGASGKGQGVTLGLFELGAYQPSDIRTYTSEFFGPTYNPPLTDINVDGGPLTPKCPLGDTCPAEFNGYFNDIEVDADIETQLAVAPDVTRLLVYNAPNDFTGQTVLDEYTQIANDDAAASVSSSYGECEAANPVGFVQAENLIFEQMALQGQSMFSSSGDNGAFDCLQVGSGIVNVDDPPAQPWVTAVGGTSLEMFNPRQNPHPPYPAGVETVWNPGNLCNASKDEAGLPGFDYCLGLGASGGGNSQYWGRLAAQRGPGVTSKYSTRGNGSTQCALAARGTLCREVPDISADADELTPYAEFCTGGLSTPNSDCATFSGDQAPPGWFGIGGTSLSSPLWSAIIADRDSFLGRRSGNISSLIYQLYRTDPGKFFHDITAAGHVATNNGKFPTVPGYDLATGIGTPIMAALITGTR